MDGWIELSGCGKWMESGKWIVDSVKWRGSGSHNKTADSAFYIQHCEAENDMRLTRFGMCSAVVQMLCCCWKANLVERKQETD